MDDDFMRYLNKIPKRNLPLNKIDTGHLGIEQNHEAFRPRPRPKIETITPREIAATLRVLRALQEETSGLDSSGLLSHTIFFWAFDAKEQVMGQIFVLLALAQQTGLEPSSNQDPEGKR